MSGTARLIPPRSHPTMAPMQVLPAVDGGRA